jgi:xanthine dehydrogenase small subunit
MARPVTTTSRSRGTMETTESSARSAVRFVLDGRIVSASQPPNTTVLDFLREQLRQTGTKEGCAEGDCGACVVLVGSLNDQGNQIQYVPVNACLQLLPTLHGKSIKTIESLARADGTLHPVQQAMVACHGSQCGFCTPGIVMSLAHLAQSNSAPTRADICDALSGNLCRCTGYKPIIEAAHTACGQSADALAFDDKADLALLRQLRGTDAPPAGYCAPDSVEGIARELEAHPGALLLAGSTEVGLWVNKRDHAPDRIIFLGNAPELRCITETATAWRIGAMVPLEQVMNFVAVPYPDFAEVLRRFGSPPIRSTATLGGNIANGSPIGDSMPCLMALGALLHLRMGDSTRTLPLEQFYIGHKRNGLRKGEFIEAIELPKPAHNAVFHARKVSKRFDQDIAALTCAMSCVMADGVMTRVRVALCGVAPSPLRAGRLEAVLEGNRPENVTVRSLDGAIGQSFAARDGLRASWRYRALLVRNVLLQFVEEIATPQMEAA